MRKINSIGTVGRTAVIPALICAFAADAFGQGSIQIAVPNGHVYWNNGDFITTAFTPSSTITANFVTMNCLDDNGNDAGAETFEVAITTDAGGTSVLASAQITNNFRNTGGCDEHRYSFDFSNISLTGGTTYYLRTKVLAGAEVRAWAGATLYYGGGVPSYSRVTVGVPNGHVYWNNGDFLTTAFTLPDDGTARFATMGCLDDNINDAGSETFEVAITSDAGGTNVLTSAQITNNFRNTGGCDAHMYLFDFGDVSLTGGTTYYLRTKVLAGAEVRTWAGDYVYYTPVPQPACAVSPTTLDFGTVTLGDQEDLTFTITNTGGGTLDGNVSESCNHYSIVSGGGAYSLGAGEERTVTVRFAPTSTGTKTCTVETGTALCNDVSCTGTGEECQPGSIQIAVPNGHVYWNNGDFITTAFTPSSTITANFVTMNCLDDNGNDAGAETFEVAITTDAGGTSVLASAQITNNFRNTGGCDEHRYSFDFSNVSLAGGTTYYLRTKVLAGAEVRAWAGATLYYCGGVPPYSRVTVAIPNGHVYWNNGDFLTTAFTLASNGTARFATMGCLDDNSNDAGSETFEVAITSDAGGANVLASAQITNNFRNTGGCDAHMYLFDFGDVYLTGGTTYYLRTKVLAGAAVRSWAGDYVYYTAEPTCAVSPIALDFGTVDVGDQEDLTFTIANTGGGALDGNVSESCDHYSVVSGGGAYSLGAGEERTVTVRFAPTSHGTQTCTVETGAALCSNVLCSGSGWDPTAAPEGEGLSAPDAFTLGENRPNPFKPSTEITYGLPVECRVVIEIYDVLGQRVNTLVDEYQMAGFKSARWDGENDHGVRVSGGVYFCRMRAGTHVETIKMILLN